ncbi:MAG: cell division protein FtsZ, partial [Alphaproteobacteria bacterium]|nr:cell division protein FtsZ [Alphaproteobacteria bacterium]
TVMTEMGKAMMGTGEAEGEKRAIAAAEAAIANPLLDDVSMKGARGVLINITGGADMTLYEVDEAANRIREEVDADANIIFGATLDETLNGRVRISMVATGIEAAAQVQPRPLSLVGGGRTNAIAAPRSDARPALAAATARAAMPASIGNNALSLSAQLAPQPVMQAVPVAAPAPMAVPVAAAPAPMPAPAPVPVAEEDEQASLLIANATAATPVAAMQAAPLARPKAPTMAAPLAAPPATAQPAAPPAAKSANLLTKGFVPTQQAIAAAAAERKAAHPVAEPQAPAMDAPFIAPAPAEPTVEPARAKADPFAEAAMANGARTAYKPALQPAPQQTAPQPMPQRMMVEPDPMREPVKERSSGLDLFKRVTGLASLRRPSAPAPAATGAPAKADAVKDAPRTAPQIGGLNPADRPQAARQEDDLLDIPAFLRRQAN